MTIKNIETYTIKLLINCINNSNVYIKNDYPTVLNYFQNKILYIINQNSPENIYLNINNENIKNTDFTIINQNIKAAKNIYNQWNKNSNNHLAEIIYKKNIFWLPIKNQLTIIIISLLKPISKIICQKNLDKPKHINIYKELTALLSNKRYYQINPKTWKTL